MRGIWKKSIMILACCIMMCSSTSTAKEVPENMVIKPYAQNFRRSENYLSISGTTAETASLVEGVSGTTSVSISMGLEKKDSDRWLRYATWSDSVNGSKLSMERNCSVTTGTYRLVTRFTVVTNGQSESKIVISSEQKCN
ncbi:MAG: hypothetical protein ACI4EX_03260 [Lachnospiraceae bacterium]